MNRRSKWNNSTQAPEYAEAPIHWHSLEPDLVLQKLQASLHGLQPEEVLERRQEFGPNTLPSRRPPSLVRVLLHQFASPLIYVLLAASIVALSIGDLKDAVFIFGVILLNAAIGTVQEWRAEQSAHALAAMLQVQVQVRRAGKTVVLKAEELVPGDVVLLESGDKVPADLRLVETNNLALDESLLTGESIAVEKNPAVLPEQTLLSERRNMAAAGASVLRGRGLGLVVATGAATEVGKIARTVAEEKAAKPPLIIRMERFAQTIGLVILALGAALGAIAFSRGMSFAEALLLAIAISVSAIPEGLPVAMTVALSLGATRMARRHVVVRRLAAVESLGSCTTIASDKTGTLTVNQQTVRRLTLPDGTELALTGQGYNGEGHVTTVDGGTPPAPLQAHLERLGRAAVLCNEGSLSPAEDGSWQHAGDAMDVALLALGYKLGLDPQALRARHPVRAEIPFESEKRYAAVRYGLDGEQEIALKGAPEQVLAFCDRMLTAEGEQPLDAAAIRRQAEAMAQQGYRVLAIASGAGGAADAFGEDTLPPLCLLGLAGFLDPLRPEVKAAVAEAHRAGIKVVMITGDHPSTALAIARELGIAQGAEEVVTGETLGAIGSHEVPEFFALVKASRVFARVTPHQKLWIVDALTRLGEFVAVTGDGVNDAPALRKAHIGVAMGSGTDVARDTASMIVTDDNFASIIAGVEEGRFAYGNVRKVTLFLISTGAAELLLIGVCVLLGLPIPLLAVQILWLNMVTNGIQDVALAFEAGEKELMDLPPRRPAEGIINRAMIEQVLLSSVTMAGICFAAWMWMHNAGWPQEAARGTLLTLLVMLQFYHVFNCRSEFRSILRVPLHSNRLLMVGMAVAFALHVLATEVPLLQGLLRLQPIAWQHWLLMAVAGVPLWIVMEAYKLARGHRPA
ncbi:MAG: cation-translocating P-type ATPase [Anaerolineae bacterium]